MDKTFEEFLRSATTGALRRAIEDTEHRMLCRETRRRRMWRLCDQLQVRRERGEC